MEKFLKENWFKLGIVIIAGLIAIIYVSSLVFRYVEYRRCYYPVYKIMTETMGKMTGIKVGEISIERDKIKKDCWNSYMK